MEKLFLFKPFPFDVGQKIRITDGPRRGDWEVIDVSKHKVTLKCPVTGAQIVADRFCFFLEELEEFEWPEKHKT